MLNEHKVQGEMAALRAVCVALIASHSDKAALLAALEQVAEQTMARSLPTAASDEALQAAEQTLNAFLAPLRAQHAEPSRDQRSG